MKTKILNWFGLTTLTTYREIEDRAKEYHKLISDLTLAISEYEAKPKPVVDYLDYNSNGYTKESFDKWYDIYCRNQYESFKIRQLSKHPHLLKAFMTEFGNFDWESIADYMKKVNWFWSDNKVSPTVSQLQGCVITLILEDNFDYIGNACSSGGFKVTLYYDEYTNPVCKIEFDKSK